MKAKPKYKSPKGKQAEVTAESLLRLAHSHTWFSKDHYKRSRNKELPRDLKVSNLSIATVHKECASILRVEAKKIRAKR